MFRKVKLKCGIGKEIKIWHWVGDRLKKERIGWVAIIAGRAISLFGGGESTSVLFKMSGVRITFDPSRFPGCLECPDLFLFFLTNSKKISFIFSLM